MAARRIARADPTSPDCACAYRLGEDAPSHPQLQITTSPRHARTLATLSVRDDSTKDEHGSPIRVTSQDVPVTGCWSIEPTKMVSAVATPIKRITGSSSVNRPGGSGDLCPLRIAMALWPDPNQRTRLPEIRETSKLASPMPNTRAGSAKPKDSRSASPARKTNLHKSKGATALYPQQPSSESSLSQSNLSHEAKWRSHKRSV